MAEAIWQKKKKKKRKKEKGVGEDSHSIKQM